MAIPDSYRSICEKFDISRATALSATQRVVKTLYDLALTIIKWSSAISGFPKIIGTIDSTHINIPAPRVEPASYVNRKGHHSIQLQAVCNYKAHFIHCFAGHPGFVHDQQVFRLSELQEWLGNPEKFPDDCHILGDAAYKLHQNVIVPYRDNGHLTPRQINFNFFLAMNTSHLIPMFIIACCVMHICFLRENEIDLDFHTINEAEGNNYLYQDAAPLERAGIAKRDLICETSYAKCLIYLSVAL
ncbi:hypothetical protein ACFW04_013602 [Cataglyphis niger]